MTLFPIETVKPKAASAPDHCTSICHRRPNSDARDATCVRPSRPPFQFRHVPRTGETRWRRDSSSLLSSSSSSRQTAISNSTPMQQMQLKCYSDFTRPTDLNPPACWTTDPKKLLGMDQLAILQMGMEVEQFRRQTFYKYAIKFSHLGRAHPPPLFTALSLAGFILHTLIRLFRIQNEAPIDTSSACLHLCGTR